LVITVPAFRFLWSPHDDEHQHKRRYVASSLRSLLKENGLRIQLLSYYNAWLFPLIAPIRLARRVFASRQVASDLKLPKNLTNRMLAAIFSSERHILTRARIPFGVSLLAVAQNP
jgi:hypothetical protein